jgi:hypothetical protein
MALVRDTGEPPFGPWPTASASVAAAMVAGVVGGVVALAVLAIAGSSADASTAVRGIDTSLVTVPNAVTNFVFDTGVDQFHEGYSWPTYPGVALFLIAGFAFASVECALIAGVLGPRPDWGAAVFFGLLFGIFLQTIVLDAVIDGMQDVNVLHSAAPVWGWWAANGLFGLTVALSAAAVIRRAAPRAREPATRS